jgi:hypothetical protein
MSGEAEFIKQVAFDMLDAKWDRYRTGKRASVRAAVEYGFGSREATFARTQTRKSKASYDAMWHALTRTEKAVYRAHADKVRGIQR